MTTTVRWTATLAATIATVATLTACSGPNNSTAAATSAKPTPAFDPCTQISDTTLSQANLDPSTKSKDVGGVHYTGWDLCAWKALNFDVFGATGYSVTVYSTNSESLDQLRHNPSSNHLVDMTIAGHRALQYHFGGGDPNLDCNVAFATAGNGVILVTADGSTAGSYTEPLCATDQRAATALFPAFASYLTG